MMKQCSDIERASLMLIVQVQVGELFLTSCPRLFFYLLSPWDIVGRHLYKKDQGWQTKAPGLGIIYLLGCWIVRIIDVN